MISQGAGALAHEKVDLNTINLMRTKQLPFLVFSSEINLLILRTCDPFPVSTTRSHGTRLFDLRKCGPILL